MVLEKPQDLGSMGPVSQWPLKENRNLRGSFQFHRKNLKIVNLRAPKGALKYMKKGHVMSWYELIWALKSPDLRKMLWNTINEISLIIYSMI